jgi:hypothetical protein
MLKSCLRATRGGYNFCYNFTEKPLTFMEIERPLKALLISAAQ